MGMHTWFYRDRKAYKQHNDLSQVLDDHDTGKAWLDSTEHYQVTHEEQELRKKNSASFHDCFRISKKEADGTYCEDVIKSREECERWLKDNAEFVHDLDQERVDEFWDTHPNGVIDFG